MLGSFRLNKHIFLGFSSLFLLLLLNAGVTAQESTITRSAATAVAGNQLPLFERMLNGYIMVGLEINYEEYLEQLQSDVRRFERQTAALSAYAATPSMSEQLDIIRKNWVLFKAIVSSTPQREKSRELGQLADVMESAIGEVLGEMAAESGSDNSVNFQEATQLALVSQKMTRLYLMRTWGLFRVQEQEALIALHSDFNNRLEALRSAENISNDASSTLKRVETQWRVYSYILERKDQPTVPMQTAVIANKVMRLLQEAATHYISQQ